MWTFALAPTGSARGSETWPKGVRVGGGSVWTTLTVDTTSGSLFVSACNPGPDFFGDYRPGANLFTGSVVVLDARTGALRTWYQLVPHDVHDWDQAAAPTLVTTRPRLTAPISGISSSHQANSSRRLCHNPISAITSIR